MWERDRLGVPLGEGVGEGLREGLGLGDSLKEGEGLGEKLPEGLGEDVGVGASCVWGWNKQKEIK